MVKTHKKNLIINYKNLPDKVRELFKERYPDGYSDYLQRTVKPNGESIFSVPLETDDTNYMVKFDVRVDSGMVEEDDDYLSDEAPKTDDTEFVPLSEALDKEEGISSGVGPLRHGGNYEDFLDDIKDDEAPKKKKKKFHDDEEDLDDFSHDMDEEEEDDYEEEEEDEEEEVDMDDPSDEELKNMDEFTQGILNDDLSDLGIKYADGKRRAENAKEEESKKTERKADTHKGTTKNNTMKKGTLKDIMNKVEDIAEAMEPKMQAVGRKVEDIADAIEPKIQAAGKKVKAAAKTKAAPQVTKAKAKLDTVMDEIEDALDDLGNKLEPKMQSAGKKVRAAAAKTKAAAAPKVAAAKAKVKAAAEKAAKKK